MLHTSAERQRRIVQALSAHAKPCMVYNPALEAFWNPGRVDQSSLPLVEYMRRDFSPELAIGDYQIWTRR